ncbi:hypothetical protein [Acidovorax sp. Leaf160]|uniref:hypothetical protein n=1 Tax=Acidovorax sp. Leaf160 TaxID=1736280 RepID=UPI0006FD547A|nr:hypothetical protein [Acidovorax sp. Leaf160]KQR44933.1 hypothetical protein ASF94_09710 [Acidovorax sp. Leaf160]
MPTIHLSPAQRSTEVSDSSMKPWVVGIGSVVIAIQLVAVGMVVSGQVEQAARQAVKPVQVSSTVDLHPANMAQ